MGDYAQEVAFCRRLFDNHSDRPPRALLELVSGGGHNAAHLKQALAFTLVDLEPAVLALSCRLNPECEHIQGDMRSVRLGRALRYLVWRWVLDSKTDVYVTDTACLLRDADGVVKVIHDRHLMGLFPRTVWLELIATAGFEPLVVSFEHGSHSDTGHEVFLGLRPVAGESV